MPQSNCDEGRAIDRVVYDLDSSLDAMVEERLRAVSLATILQSAMSLLPPPQLYPGDRRAISAFSAMGDALVETGKIVLHDTTTLAADALLLAG